MEKIYENITEENMCDLMCGKPEDEFGLEEYEKRFLATMFRMIDYFFSYMEENGSFYADYIPFNDVDLANLAEKLGINY